ncbi:restriction endonuclease [Chimaeribacter californicus]|uniref:Restriction endonuclease n=1 Tax=Chimaeribacter californicus TaxID=2060067 RepID=A0A2N5EF43_9GAMM|nr:HNH endonuclease signature motif containing protein [Chimaeribacter californicus]PLR41149.1 restriction endonuclease [Chimaeribacter californicus]
MLSTTLWTRDQLLVAFTLYSQLPFGQMHSKNSTIQYYADLIGRTPSALAMKLVNIASLDPFITNSGRTGLTGASNADRRLWEEMNQDPDKFEHECQSVMAMYEPPTPVKNDEEPADFTGKEEIKPVKTRIGQQLFRKRVLEAYDNRCCITGLEDPILLIASHIRPWKADPRYRLDPRNGLCLSNLHDRAFDQGLITFNEDLELVLSIHLKRLKSVSARDNFLKYEGVKIRHSAQFSPSEEHLDFHRKHIFIDNL